MKDFLQTMGIVALAGLGVIVFFIFIAWILTSVLGIAVKKEEIHRCYQLETYSKEYHGFYLTRDEKIMCDGHGIIIKADIQ